MNNYQIKILAALFMLIDHIGALFLPTMIGWRIVGRFSLPLFMLLLVDGEQHTHRFRHYCLRLLLLGVLSQPIFGLLFPANGWNILFTLLLGLLCLRGVRQLPRWEWVIWFGGGAIAQALNLEYGIYGILAIALIRHLPPSWRFPTPHFLLRWWVAWITLHVALGLLVPTVGVFQLPAIAAPFLLGLANHQPGQKARWFYLFYPVHLLVLGLLRLWLAQQGLNIG